MSYFALLEFLDRFVKKRWRMDLKKRDDEGSTVIHWAIRNRIQTDTKDSEAAQMVKALVKLRKDPNAHDNEASRHGRLHLVQLLINKDADLDRKSNERETTLIAACREHHEEVITAHLEAGANVEVQSFFGTALQAVSLIGCESCVKSILKKYKAQTKPIEELKGTFGTSLHAGAFHGHLNVVELLLGEKIREENPKAAEHNTMTPNGGPQRRIHRHRCQAEFIRERCVSMQHGRDQAHHSLRSGVLRVLDEKPEDSNPRSNDCRLQGDLAAAGGEACPSARRKVEPRKGKQRWRKAG
ncbi:ankyrin repeat-containing domain protein [Phyllosticta citriasiana]|uniref:ankyrin repeat-containing domain protein n=1 Tax=Phyllosticta citriasiana TaxID=595635 RepID=UPI0030FD556F